MTTRPGSMPVEYRGDAIEAALALSRIPLFAGLAPETLLPLAHVVERRTLAAGEVLCNEGDFGDGLYVVISGALDVVLGDLGHAKKADVQKAMAGHVIGQGQLVGTYAKGG